VAPIADRGWLLTVRPAGDVDAPAGGPPAMTAADQRFSPREAADLTDKSVDTLRRRVKSGKPPAPTRPTRPARSTSPRRR